MSQGFDWVQAGCLPGRKKTENDTDGSGKYNGDQNDARIEDKRNVQQAGAKNRTQKAQMKDYHLDEEKLILDGAMGHYNISLTEIDARGRERKRYQVMHCFLERKNWKIHMTELNPGGE